MSMHLPPMISIHRVPVSTGQWACRLRVMALAVGSCVLTGIASAAETTERSVGEKSAENRAIRSEPEVLPIERKKVPYQQARIGRNVIDWTTAASTYTHNDSGQRVDQFAEGAGATVVERKDFQRSGFRHSRSTLQTGFSSDNYHSVEQWGPDVRPYGEWRYPNRPFAVPYGMWGPQPPQVMGGMPWGPGYPGMYPPVGPGMPPTGAGPWNALGPTQDDYYPQAPIYNTPGSNFPWGENSGAFRPGTWDGGHQGNWPNPGHQPGTHPPHHQQPPSPLRFGLE